MSLKHYGLLGAHRVGKTSLAKTFNSFHPSIPYTEFSVYNSLLKFGFNPKDHYDIRKRLYIQRNLLDDFSVFLSKVQHQSVFDRTPLDMLMYMQADVLRDFPSNLEMEYAKYYSDAIVLFDTYFCSGVIVQPGIPLVDVEKSASASPAYMEHCNSLCLAFSVNHEEALDLVVMDRDCLSLVDRLYFLNEVWGFDNSLLRENIINDQARPS